LIKRVRSSSVFYCELHICALVVSAKSDVGGRLAHCRGLRWNFPPRRPTYPVVIVNRARPAR